MLDEETGEAQMCVVDLDTVMPGVVLYDFGDMIRTTTSRTAEDEQFLDRVELEMPMFEALTRGYVEATRDFLTPAQTQASPAFRSHHPHHRHPLPHRLPGGTILPDPS